MLPPNSGLFRALLRLKADLPIFSRVINSPAAAFARRGVAAALCEMGMLDEVVGVNLPAGGAVRLTSMWSGIHQQHRGILELSWPILSSHSDVLLGGDVRPT